MPEINCPLCGVQVSSDKVPLAQHFINCGLATLNSCASNGTLIPAGLVPSLTTPTLPSQTPILPASPSPPPSPPPSLPTTKKRGASPKKATAKAKQKVITMNDNETDEEDASPSSSSPVPSPPSRKKSKAEKTITYNTPPAPPLLPPVSSTTTTMVTTTTTTTTKKAKKITMTEQEYDDFLKKEKGGRFVRTGKWQGFSTNTDHKCADPECAREWRPAPEKCLPDDYYCPSCVLHHRNNVARFGEARLAWTAIIPNTFYVFSITDPKTKTKLTKFGRTQHADAWKRYPSKEVKEYKMELMMTLRGKLVTMTNIENWWKEHAEANKLFCRFSNAEFHGATECLELDEKTLKFMKEKSNEMHLADP